MQAATLSHARLAARPVHHHRTHAAARKAAGAFVRCEAAPAVAASAPKPADSAALFEELKAICDDYRRVPPSLVSLVLLPCAGGCLKARARVVG